jgi:hypothetical protein
MYYITSIIQEMLRDINKMKFKEFPQKLMKYPLHAVPYPEFQGEYLRTLLQAKQHLVEFHKSANTILETLRQMTVDSRLIQIEYKKAGLSAQLQSEMHKASRGFWQNLLGTVGAVITGGITGGVAAEASFIGNLIDHSNNTKELINKIGNLEKRKLILEFQNRILNGLHHIKQNVLTFVQSFLDLNNSIERLRTLKRRVENIKERFRLEKDEEYANAVSLNPMWQARLRRDIKDYNRAVRRAKRAAKIARKAIEAKFVVNLSEEYRPSIYGESPSEWVDALDDIEGYIDEKVECGEAGSSETGPKGEWCEYWPARLPIEKALQHYVQMLEDFVDSYPFLYPFTQGDDYALISLRDDILIENEACRGSEGPTLILYSEDLQVQKTKEGRDVWVRVNLDVTLEPIPSIGGMETLTVTSPEKGTLVQEVRIAEPGIYQASVEYEGGEEDYGEEADEAFLRVNDAITPLVVTDRPQVMTYNFKVEEPDTLVTFGLELSPGAQLRVGRTNLVKIYEVDDLPSDAKLEELVVLGPYSRTLDTRQRIEPGCTVDYFVSDPVASPHEDSVKLFKNRFIRVCKDGLRLWPGRGSCEGHGGVDYYEARFTLSLAEIERERGNLEEIIALGNYNYRHFALAVNLVGTNLIDCAKGEAPASCYNRAYIPYTMLHSGATEVLNRANQKFLFIYPPGRIEHAKALLAERVLTNPLTSTDTTLLADYMRYEFKGRPLQGEYYLRIYHVPTLNWDNIEDVQIVLKYHYWTKTE